MIYFQEFYKATNDLEGQEDATIHLVCPWITKLKKHCTVTDEDSPEMATLKESCLHYLKVHFTDFVFA